MQERTKLEIDTFKYDEYAKIKKKWSELAEEMNKRGIYHSGNHVYEFLEIGFNYIDGVLDKFFDVEKTAINKKNLPDNYFIDLTDEIIKLIGSECDLICTKALEEFGRDKHFEQPIFSEVENRRGKNNDTIIKEVKRLQEDSKATDSDIYKQPIEEKIEIPTFDFIKIGC